MFVTPRKRALSPIEFITLHRLDDVDFWRDGDSTDSESSDSDSSDEGEVDSDDMILIDTSLTISTPAPDSEDEQTQPDLALALSPSKVAETTPNRRRRDRQYRSEPFSQPPLGLSHALILRTPLFLGSSHPCLLSKEEVDDVYELFPIRFLNNGHFHLVYSTREHGMSIGTLYLRSIKSRLQVSLLIIQTHRGERLGCFTTEPWRLPSQEDDVVSESLQPRSRKKRRVRLYYGSGECFVFSFAPPSSPPTLDALSPCDFHSFSSAFHIYKWDKTSNNRMFQYASPSGLGIGGPKFSFFIGADLSEGYSCPCATFDAPALVVGSSSSLSSQRRSKKKRKRKGQRGRIRPEYFSVAAVELWGFGDESRI